MKYNTIGKTVDPILLIFNVLKLRPVVIRRTLWIMAMLLSVGASAQGRPIPQSPFNFFIYDKETFPQFPDDIFSANVALLVNVDFLDSQNETNAEEIKNDLLAKGINITCYGIMHPEELDLESFLKQFEEYSPKYLLYTSMYNRYFDLTTYKTNYIGGEMVNYYSFGQNLINDAKWNSRKKNATINNNQLKKEPVKVRIADIKAYECAYDGRLKRADYYKKGLTEKDSVLFKLGNTLKGEKLYVLIEDTIQKINGLSEKVIKSIDKHNAYLHSKNANVLMKGLSSYPYPIEYVGRKTIDSNYRFIFTTTLQIGGGTNSPNTVYDGSSPYAITNTMTTVHFTNQYFGVIIDRKYKKLYIINSGYSTFKERKFLPGFCDFMKKLN